MSELTPERLAELRRTQYSPVEALRHHIDGAGGLRERMDEGDVTAFEADVVMGYDALQDVIAAQADEIERLRRERDDLRRQLAEAEERAEKALAGLDQMAAWKDRTAQHLHRVQAHFASQAAEIRRLRWERAELADLLRQVDVVMDGAAIMGVGEIMAPQYRDDWALVHTRVRERLTLLDGEGGGGE